MRSAAGNAFNVVDIYNGVTGAWSTAQLSVARYGLAAASVGNVALFAGGVGTGALFRQIMFGSYGFCRFALRARKRFRVALLIA